MLIFFITVSVVKLVCGKEAGMHQSRYAHGLCYTKILNIRIIIILCATCSLNSLCASYVLFIGSSDISSF